MSDISFFIPELLTLRNSDFCLMHDKKNLKLKEKILLIKEKLNKNLPTIPSTLKEELETNIFLKCDSIETFSKLRNLKDNF